MHEVTLAVNKLAEELSDVKRQLADSQKEAEYLKRDAVDLLKKEMQQALYESDIKREVAIARLEAYERNQNKDDFNKEIREMLKSAIQGLSGKSSASAQQQKPQQNPQKSDIQ